MVIRSGIKKLLLWILIFGAVYFISLSLFAIKATMLYRELRVSYEYFQERGFDPTLRDQVSRLVPRVDSLISDIEGPLISPILGIVQQEREVNALIQGYNTLQPLLPVLGELLGQESSKRYFIAFQNPAEARGTGGLVGAFAILSVYQGEVSVEQVGSNYLLALQDELPVLVPQEFKNLYSDHPAWWPNSNMSPHFPYTAQIWLGLWKKQYGEQLDGAITLDPIVLSDILSFIGPVKVANRDITVSNVVEQTLSAAYLDYEKDNEGRKEFLVEIIRTVITRALAEEVDIGKLLWSIRKSVFDHRVLLYSADDSTQKSISRSPLSGSMSLTPSNEFRVVLQNTAGNKMDYYIHRKLILNSKSCGQSRITQAIVEITNTAPKDLYLPDNYYGRQDRGDWSNPENSTSLAVLIYGPPGSKLVAAADIETGLSAGHIKTERKRPIAVIQVDISAGEKRVFSIEFQGGSGALTAYVQPLVLEQITTINDRCSR